MSLSVHRPIIYPRAGHKSHRPASASRINRIKNYSVQSFQNSELVRTLRLKCKVGPDSLLKLWSTIENRQRIAGDHELS